MTWYKFVCPKHGEVGGYNDNCDLCEDSSTYQERHSEFARKASALDVQIGGNHYKSKGIQPVEYIMANDIGFCEGSAIKYLTRWKDKGGIADLEKAKHFIDILIESVK